MIMMNEWTVLRGNIQIKVLILVWKKKSRTKIGMWNCL